MTSPATTPPAAGSPVYCSGPMFSVGDQWEQQAIASALESAGYTTYLPQRDGIEVGKVMKLVNHPLLEGRIADEIMLEVRKWVFALDMYQLLERCQALVFNLDGRTPDDGSVVETAAAFTAGKPIVIYKTTPITMLAGADNPMVEGLSSIWAYVGDLPSLPQAVATAVATASKAPSTYTAPPHVASLMKEGSEVWDVLEALRGHPMDTPEELVAWLHAIGKRLLGKPAMA
jgi:nucleoside 2-deoxyribosyltransferase